MYDIHINSSPPSAAYMHQWAGSTLVLIIACRLWVPSHYLNQCWVIVNGTLRNKLQWNSNQNTKVFIHENASQHYDDIIMIAMASQITNLTIVYSTVYSDADQRKHRSSASLAFVWGSHRGPGNSPHKWPVMRKMFPFHDVIMKYRLRNGGHFVQGVMS